MWCVCFTFDVGDVNIELGEFLTGSLHTLIHRLQDLFGILFHPPKQRVKGQRLIDLSQRLRVIQFEWN
jgi:hypothetical protein